MDLNPAGFREIEHTADWELEVWAPNLPGILEQAAIGMYTLAGVRLHPVSRITRTIALSSSDPESLLVSFLGELLYLGEQEGLGFNAFHLKIEGNTLHAELFGAPLIAMVKEIKAVTYHNLVIRQTPRGLETRIVFDV
jgi:SHS2 domain-containing protein